MITCPEHGGHDLVARVADVVGTQWRHVDEDRLVARHLIDLDIVGE